MEKIINWFKNLLGLNKTVTKKILKETSKPVKKGTGSSKKTLTKSGSSQKTVTKKVLKNSPQPKKRGTGSSKRTVSKSGVSKKTVKK